jgi:NAD(P)-dependent dehydrogenase (short-subunit alcohol dehydrogenase family)
MRLAGKTALITGGTTGIGRAAAELFRDEGARVFVTGRDPKTLAAARQQLTGIEVIESDASDLGAIEKLVAVLPAQIDIAFLNAGVLHQTAFVDVTPADFDRIYATNVKGPMFLLRALVPKLPRGASVVLNGSINASLGMKSTVLYASSKAALVSLGRVAANELAALGIRVNVLSPGPTETGIIAKHGGGEDVKKWLSTLIPMGRMGESIEIARAALFLASSDSSFMTGEEIVVDGGMTRV